MKSIEQVTIQSVSGFCSVEDAYNDILTITPYGAHYECTPYDEDSEEVIRWSYQSDSQRFEMYFQAAADIVLYLCKADPAELLVLDAGTLTLSVYYSDSTRIERKIDYPIPDLNILPGTLRLFIPPIESDPRCVDFLEDLCN